MTTSLPFVVAGLLLMGLDPSGLRHVTPLRDAVVLSISADRESYYLGEPVRLSIAVRNSSDAPVTGYFTLDPYYGDAELYYRKAGAAFLRLSGLAGDEHFIEEGRTLHPGGEYSEKVILPLSGLKRPERRFLLDQVGAYEFKMVLRDTGSDSNGVLESNLLTIQVVGAPADELAAEAAYTPDLGYVAQFRRGKGYLSPEVTRAAADFIERFPRSRYAPAVREGLRTSLSYRVRTNLATDEERALYEELFRDTTPPLLSAVASPSTLWPPNHNLVPIEVSLQVSDDHDANPLVTLVSVTCDDQGDPLSDVVGAIDGTDDRQFELRSERKGPGSGRTYIIMYSATDSAGNSATVTTTVAVPHDEHKKK